MTRIRFIEDSRAHQLYSQFEGLYFRFVEELPQDLGALALRGSTFKGVADETPFEGFSGINPIYTCTPWLFWEQFRNLPEEQLLHIASSGAFFSLASALMDHLIDGQFEDSEAMAGLQGAFYQRGVAGFKETFPDGVNFWKTFRRLNREHLLGLSIELEMQLYPRKFTIESLELTAGGKVCPMLVTVAALAEATDQPDLLAPIELSFKHTFIGGQVHDDVLDWRKDFEEGHFTYFLHQLAPPFAWSEEGKPTIEALEERLRSEHLDVKYIDWAKGRYESALEAVSGIACEAWVVVINEYLEIAEEHKKELMFDHFATRVKEIADAGLLDDRQANNR